MRGNLDDGQLCCPEQRTGASNSSLQNVAIGGHTQTLSEGASEVILAQASETGEFGKREGPAKPLVDEVADPTEMPLRQPPSNIGPVA